MAPPEDTPHDATWFIDGSSHDEFKRIARRTGFGVVLVSSTGTLLAYGAGEPPHWIVDAAGAEAWAYYFVLSHCSWIPKVVTDCKGILDTLSNEPSSATGYKKALARTWQHIRHTLDDDFPSARCKLVWMPSHVTAANFGSFRDSTGSFITATMWRANRLADALAKHVASRHRLPAYAMDAVKTAKTLVRYHAAKLGVATYRANHFEVQVSTDGGGTCTRVFRDSVAQRPFCRTSGSARSSGETAATGTTKVTVLPTTVPGPERFVTFVPQSFSKAPSRKRAASSSSHELRRLADEERVLAELLASLRLRPSLGPSATDRLSAVRRNVLSKLNGGAAAEG